MPIPGTDHGDSIYDFDVTKLSVNTLDVGLAGTKSMIFSDEYVISRSNLEIREIFWLIFPSETGHGRSSVWSVLFLRSGGASAGKRAA